MKILFAVFVAALLFGCSAPNRESISAVRSACRNASQASMVTRQTDKKRWFNPARYYSAICKIDVSHCPDDFRTAWGVYLAAWHDRTTAGDTKTALLELATSRDPSGLLGLNGEIESADKRCRESRESLERVAEKYGALDVH